MRTSRLNALRVVSHIKSTQFYQRSKLVAALIYRSNTFLLAKSTDAFAISLLFNFGVHNYYYYNTDDLLIQPKLH